MDSYLIEVILTLIQYLGIRFSQMKKVIFLFPYYSYISNSVLRHGKINEYHCNDSLTISQGQTIIPDDLQRLPQFPSRRNRAQSFGHNRNQFGQLAQRIYPLSKDHARFRK